MANGVKTAAAATTVMLGALVLGGCGADDPYCVAVETHQKTLDSFGAERSDDAYASYAKALASISKVAPAPVDEESTDLTRATKGVVSAQKDVGFALQDMADEDKRTALSAGDIDVLNKAYKRFNNTTPQRKAIVADVKKTCDIQLK